MTVMLAVTLGSELVERRNRWPLRSCVQHGATLAGVAYSCAPPRQPGFERGNVESFSLMLDEDMYTSEVRSLSQHTELD